MSGELNASHKSDNYLPEAHEAGSRWVTMSNALTRAGHGLTLSEKRIVAIAASKLDSRQTLRPGEVPTTKIAAAEYAETFDITLDAAYQQLSAAAKALHKRHITFFEPSFKRNGKALKPTRVEMNWVGQVNYQEGEGWVELHWWPALMRHLVGLKKQFTSYQLQQASALRSAHSWRLLELLMRFKSTGWAEYSIEDFCEAMDATEKQRADFAKIRTKIIEPAIKELTEKDGWLIQWLPVKAGRKVKAIRFNFMRNPQQRLDLDGTAPEGRTPT
jgi:plasmid replication initiation protein